MNEKEIKDKILENLANIVTLFGLFGAIWILIIAIRNTEELWSMMIIAAFVVFTDWLDGEIARSRGRSTKFGAVLDPLRDKVFVVPSLIILTWYYRWIAADLPVILVTAIIALVALLLFIESILFIGWWAFLFAKKTSIQSHKWSKRKTGSEFIVIILWLISLVLEIELKKPVIQYSIYFIGLTLIVTDILAYVALKVYFQEYIELNEGKAGN